jgi:hypothetical protein
MPIKPAVQTKPTSYNDFHSLDYEGNSLDKFES